MLRAVTVDDELPNHSLFKRLIEEEGHVEVVGQFTDPLSFIEQAAEIRPDVVFLDIEMPVMNGLEVADRLISICPDAQTVVVTAYSQYAIEAFRVNALDYLLKPIDPEEMRRVIQKLIKNMNQNEPPTAAEIPESLNQCRIRCLGDFQVYGKGSDRPVQWLTAKVEELLAYLIIHSQKTVSKSELCDVLWPDSDFEKGVMNLYTTVYRLRKTVIKEGVSLEITSNKNGYQLDLTGCTVDYKEFESLTHDLEKIGTIGETDKEIEDWLKAEKNYQGELFANRPYLWSAPSCEAINQMYRLLCYRLSAHFMEQNQLEGSVRYLRNLLTAFPDEEKACILLMDIYKIQKNSQGIEKLYEEYSKYLREELNIVPTNTFQKHYDSLKHEPLK